MVALPNQRHESFAQHRAQGKTADEAYRLAGFKPHRGNASRLSSNESILSRVAELQAKAVKKVEASVEGLATELEEARVIAIADRQASAAVAATMGKAKLFGFGKETRRIEGTLQTVNLQPEDLAKLTDDELDQLEAAMVMLTRLGVIGGDNDNETDEGEAA